jgi:HlyD family type I secretion membrane fusion protein
MKNIFEKITDGMVVFYNNIKHYIHIAKLALIQERENGDSKLKHMNNHEKEFLPAVLEVTETPPSHAARLLTYIIISIFTVAMIWSYFGKIDIIATARGKLIPASHTKKIQSLEAGVIEKIFVADGDVVQKGDILIKLNPTEAKADINRLQSEIKAQKIAVRRLIALLTETPEANFTKQEDDGDLYALHKNLLNSEMANKNSQINVLSSQIEEARSQLITITSEIKKLDKILPSMIERAKRRKKLVEQGYYAEITYMEMQERVISTQEEKNVLNNKKNETKARIASLNKEINQYKAKFNNDISQKLTDTEEKLNSYRQELIKAEEIEKRTYLKSPIDGIVQELKIHTVGGVIKPADEIMSVIPINYKIEADVMVENKDIGFVSQDQIAEIKVDSFPFTKYGTIDGKVRVLSNDAVEKEKIGLVFPAKITMMDNKIIVGEKEILLKPGMSITAEIKTGKRRVIEYILSPIIKHLNESIRER